MLNVFHANFSSGLVQLDREESHHLVAVRRARKGAPVRLLDGKGAVGEGVVLTADSRRAVVECATLVRNERQRPQVFLLQALPKGKTMDLVVQKATELGVAGIFPLHTRNSESRLDQSRSERKVEKWKQVAVESLKQCGNPFLPQIHPPLPLEAISTLPRAELSLVASLAKHARSLVSIVRDHAKAASVAIAIGPEGDFDADEYSLLQDSGFFAVTLGPNVLRLETAAIAAIAIVGELFRFEQVTE